MPLDFTADPVPLRYDEGGTIRVGKTRVRLDSVVYLFNEGKSADDVVDEYPTLDLADVYLVLGYYLRHRPEVDAYVAENEAYGEALRKQIEAEFPTDGLRAKLEARLAAKRASA